MIDVKQLLAQLEKSEKGRIGTDSRLSETTKALNSLKETSEKQAVIRDKLTVNQ